MEDSYSSISNGTREPSVPLWMKIVVLTSSVAVVGNTVALCVMTAKVIPVIKHVSHNLSGVFEGLDNQDLSKALQQAIYLLDLVCSNMLDCSSLENSS